MMQDLGDIFGGLFQRLLSVLPASPFQAVSLAAISSDWLAWLNWFFPVSEALAVMEAWLLAIAVYYLWSIVARWVKVVGS